MTALMCCIVTLGGGASVLGGEPGEWPGFRGANVDGTYSGTGVFDRAGGVGLKVAWKNPLGSGYSAVAVAEECVVTMFSDGTSDVVIAFDENSGAELWRYEIGPTYKGHDGSHDGPISTPLIAGNRVFCLAPRGEWFALDVASGKPAWSTHLVDDHETKMPHYGFGTSPMMMGGVVVLQTGAKDAAVAGFDSATGKKLWATGSDGIGYQSPIPYAIKGRRQVLAAGSTKLLGIDAPSGELLWEYEHGGDGARGVASLVPVPAGEGRLFLAYKDNSSTAVELDAAAEKVTFKTLWEDRAIRNSYNVPVYHDGHVYAYSSRFLVCAEVATGKVKWRSRQPGDGFMSLVDGHLVLATKEGGLHVAKATPAAYEEVAAVPQLFDDLAWCTPAFANRRIFVRGLNGIAAVDVTSGAAVAATGAAGDAGSPPAGTRFGVFLQELRGASDKGAVIDRFLATNPVPVVEGEWVHFVYRGPGTDMAVAGDMFGARQERPMSRVDGTDLFYYSMQLEPDARVNYLLIQDYEEMIDPANPRKTATTMLTEDMEMSFSGEEMEMSWVSMPKWQPPAHLEEPPEARRGRIETVELVSKIMVKQRMPWEQPAEGEEGKADEPQPLKHTIEVYLPAGYDRGTERLPVAYVFDGVNARERGQLPRSLDNLIGTRVRPVIAVLVHEQPNFWSGDPSPYMRMFSEELIPYVDEHYRTVASPEGRATIGMGFAGYTAFMCAFSSDKIGKIAGQSPFVMDSMMGPLAMMIPGPDARPMQIYLDWGKYDMRNPHENWDISDSNRKLAKMLEEKGYPIAGGEAPDGCDWPSWVNRTDDLFETLYPL